MSGVLPELSTDYSLQRRRTAPTSPSEREVLEHFLPQKRGGRRGWRHCCGLVCTAVVGLVSFGVTYLGLECFLIRGDACYFKIASLQDYFTHADADTRQYFHLLTTLMLSVAIITLLWACGEVGSHVLRCQRTSRLRHRVEGAMAGVTSRTEATRKMMHDLRSVMELVHDSSLKITLTFEGVSYRLRDGTYVLSDASGSVAADEITVLMGPSGCGKSTLLHLLSGKLVPHRGKLSINGKEGSVRELHKLIAFVPQVSRVPSRLVRSHPVPSPSPSPVPSHPHRHPIPSPSHPIPIAIPSHRHPIPSHAAPRFSARRTT
jgi:hypothetical protein